MTAPGRTRPCPWRAWRDAHSLLVERVAASLRAATVLHYIAHVGGHPDHITVPAVDGAPGVTYRIVPRLAARGASYRVWKDSTAPTVIRDETVMVADVRTPDPAVYALVLDRQRTAREI